MNFQKFEPLRWWGPGLHLKEQSSRHIVSLFFFSTVWQTLNNNQNKRTATVKFYSVAFSLKKKFLPPAVDNNYQQGETLCSYGQGRTARKDYDSK